MERLVQALLALALVAPTLAAPGPQFASLAQQPLDIGLNANNPRLSLTDTPSAPSTNLFPRTTADEAAGTYPLELRKHKKPKKPTPSDNHCTPGDRYCHASLDEVLFCNDNQQWVRYSQCQAGTFCHRLHLVCVSEIYADANTPASPITTAAPQTYNDAPNQCKEGDRRCSAMFNRVDRCTHDREWVTYHDCRRSEVCDDVILECLPRTADSM